MKTKNTMIICFFIFLFTDLSFGGGRIYEGDWRWRNDDGDVYTATWHDSLNTPLILTDYNNIRLRTEILSSSYADSLTIGLSYIEWPGEGNWIPITTDDTGKFFISSSPFLFDTMSYFDNKLLPPDSLYLYRKTITFDATNNYSMIAEEFSGYELEYSLMPTSKLTAGSAYFISLSRDNNPFAHLWTDYALILTPPVSWTKKDCGTITNWFSGVFFTDPNNGWAVDWNGAIFSTTDGGENWVSQTFGTDVRLESVFFTDQNNGMVVGFDFESYQGLILRTTDGGTSWASQSMGYGQRPQDVFFTDPDHGIIVGYDEYPTYYTGLVLATTNGGDTWTPRSSGSIFQLNSVFFSDENNGTAVGWGGIIIRTTDGGISWTSQNPTGADLFGIYFTNSNEGWAVGDAGMILKTTNGGINWVRTSNTINEALNSVYFIDNIGWITGNKGYILKTTDSGLTWTRLVSGTIKDLQSVYFINDEIGWAVGQFGTILKTTNGGITSNERKGITQEVSAFELSQNFPNPFNPATTIKFSIPREVPVNLSIYDILGEKVKELKNEVMTQGYYEVNFNASSLASGVYFYRIKAGDFVQTKKMILIK